MSSTPAPAVPRKPARYRFRMIAIVLVVLALGIWGVATWVDSRGKLFFESGKDIVATLDQLAAALGGVSSKDVKTTVDGLTKLTSALSGRSEEIGTLMISARKITAPLEAKGSVIVDVILQSDLFLTRLNERRTTITALLKHTTGLSREMTALIHDDGAPLSRALNSVDRITNQLADDSATLTKSIDLLSHFSSNLANITGNGPWIDLYLPTGLIPDNIIATCGTNPSPGCAG